VLLTVALGWLLALGTRMVLPALLPQIKAEFTLGNALAGGLLTILYIAYAATQFPAGILADRIGERRTLFASVLLTALGAVALTIAPSLTEFVAGTVLFALGSGLYGAPRVTILSRIYPDRDGTALGLTFAAGNVGSSLLPIIAGVLALVLGWRFGFGFVVLPLVAVALAVWWYVPERPTRDRTEEPARRAQLREAILTPQIGLAWVSMSLVLIAYQGMTAFLPTYFVEVKGLGAAVASTLFGLFFAAGAVWQWTAGVTADQMGSRRTLVGIGVVATVTVLVLPVIGGLLPLAILSLLLGIRLGFGPLNNAYVASALPEDVRGTGLGLFRSLQLLVSSAGSLIVGVMADAGLFDAAFLLLAGITGLGTVGYVLLPDLDPKPPGGESTFAVTDPDMD
jgi:predicted MFS family arabinose efflux permease